MTKSDAASPGRRWRSWFILTLSGAAIVIIAIVQCWPPAAPGAAAQRESASLSATAAMPLASARTAPHSTGSLLARITAAKAAELEGLFWEIMRIGEGPERSSLLAALVQHWITIDLKGLIAFVNTMEVRPSGYGDVWKIIGPALVEALPKLDDDTASLPKLKALVRRLVAYLAMTDPDTALAWAQRWLSGELLDASRAMIATQLAATRPLDAFRVFDGTQLAARRVDALNGIGAALGRVDAGRALEWAAGLAHSGERPYAMASVLRAMAETSPESAAREFERYRAQLTAEYDAQVARDRASLASNPANQAEGDLGNREVLPPPVNPQLNLLNDAGLAIAEQWAAADPAAALLWANQIPGGRLKQEVLYSALASWAAQDGAAAASYYRTMTNPDPEIAEPLFLAWAKTDPSAAAQQATSLASDTARAKAIGGTVTGWLISGAEVSTIAQWVDTLGDVPARDRARSQLADALSLEDPGAAWRQARRIQDPALRHDALELTFTALLESNPAAARRTLAAAKLPASDSASLELMLKTATGN